MSRPVSLVINLEGMTVFNDELKAINRILEYVLSLSRCERTGSSPMETAFCAPILVVGKLVGVKSGG